MMMGLKCEVMLYVLIVDVLGILFVDILFLFDIVVEIDVVKVVGMKVLLIDCEYGQVDIVSFVEIVL